MTICSSKAQGLNDVKSIYPLVTEIGNAAPIGKKYADY